MDDGFNRLLAPAIRSTLCPTDGGADGAELSFPLKLPLATPPFFSPIFFPAEPFLGFESIAFAHGQIEPEGVGRATPRENRMSGVLWQINYIGLQGVRNAAGWSGIEM
jgi:hypothetical protein